MSTQAPRVALRRATASRRKSAFQTAKVTESELRGAEIAPEDGAESKMNPRSFGLKTH